MEITAAQRSQATDIARLIMTAMNRDCCRYFVGPSHTLDDFHRIMTSLVRAEHSQYSYRNTLAATGEDDKLCGICVSYDGGKLHSLRRAFIDAMWEQCRRDFRGMDDETSRGELYIDSLAVREEERGKGIATALLRATIAKAKSMGLPAVGLLVDQGNPRAEKLYRRLGFAFENEAVWGGHAMRHLQLKF